MQKHCIDCGKPVDYRQIRCRACYDLSRIHFVVCGNCGENFKASPSHNRKFCSKRCEGIARSGDKNHFFGKHHTAETKAAIGTANSGSHINVGKDNAMWKGDDICYSSLHVWIRRYKPRPELCEICCKTPPTEVALVAEHHQRNIDAYQWLCHKCHIELDGLGKYERTAEIRKKCSEKAKQRWRRKDGKFV